MNGILSRRALAEIGGVSIIATLACLTAILALAGPTAKPPAGLSCEDAQLTAQAWARDRLELVNETLKRARVLQCEQLDDIDVGLVLRITLDTGARFDAATVVRYGWHVYAWKQIAYGKHGP